MVKSDFHSPGLYYSLVNLLSHEAHQPHQAEPFMEVNSLYSPLVP